MNVTIEEMPSFSVLAVSREFSEKNCMAEIPEFWKEYYARGCGEFACGQYGICYDANPDGMFRYAIGNRCTTEQRADGSAVYHVFNCPDRSEIPAGFEHLTVPAGTWAKFECRGPLPHSIQEMWPRIVKEWLPDSGYEKVPGFDVEEYGMCQTPEDSQKSDYQCSIWISVRRIEPELDSPDFHLATERLRNLDGTPRWADSYAYAILREESHGFVAESGLSVRVNVLAVKDYLRLFRSPGWKAPGEEQVEVALRNSLAVFSVYSDETLIGMGRLIGDRSMAYMFRDIVILPEYQHQGAGSFLIRSMLDWIAGDLPAGRWASCELFTTTGKSAFYEKFGFEPLPNAFLENGMMRMVQGK